MNVSRYIKASIGMEFYHRHCDSVVKTLAANAGGRGFESHRWKKILFCNFNFKISQINKKN